MDEGREAKRTRAGRRERQEDGEMEREGLCRPGEDPDFH